MLDAALHSGKAATPCVFELFARRLPGGRKYGVVAGTGRLLQALTEFRFTPDQLDWLARENVVSPLTIDWLADYRFTGTVRGYAEGELYFPHSPLLAFETDFAHGVVLETLALSIYNYDSAVATAASRMVTAARGRPLAEMGSRRANEDAAVAGTRAAYLAGFSASSNLEAGKVWGIPTMGTAAHAFTLLHDSEREAFASQLATMGVDTTLLVDTYDIQQGIRTAIEAAGTGLGSIRIDSGDLPTTVAAARLLLDELGALNTKITVTNDLDEHAIAALAASPVDAYGVGTSVLTGSGSPTASMVYKLTARQTDDGSWLGVQKASAGKAHIGGKKVAVRTFDKKRPRTGRPATGSENIYVGREPSASELDAGRALTHTLMTDGMADSRYLGPSGLQLAREHHRTAVAELPSEGLRLAKGDPVLPTTFVR